MDSRNRNRIHIRAEIVHVGEHYSITLVVSPIECTLPNSLTTYLHSKTWSSM